MKNKVRRNLKGNNKFNYRKHRGGRSLKEFLKNCKYIDIEIDNELGTPYGIPIQMPFGAPMMVPTGGVKIEFDPLNLQIKNGDKWEPLVGVNIE